MIASERMEQQEKCQGRMKWGNPLGSQGQRAERLDNATAGWQDIIRPSETYMSLASFSSLELILRPASLAASVLASNLTFALSSRKKLIITP